MSNACAMCGRITLNPAVLIAGHPVGPTCARKAGLMALTQRKGGLVFPVGGRMSLPKRDDKTKDLFESEAWTE